MKHIKKFENFLNEGSVTADYMNYSYNFKQALESKINPGRSFTIGNAEVEDAESDDATGKGYGELSCILQLNPFPVSVEYDIDMKNTVDEEADVTINIKVSTPEMRNPEKQTYTFKKLTLSGMDKTISDCVNSSLDKFIQKI